jgi:hypothetical protein
MLEQRTTHPPDTEGAWTGPWNMILTSLFPFSQGYIVFPRSCETDASSGQLSNNIYQVAKVTYSPFTLRTVIIVQIKDAWHWDHEKENIIQEVGRRADLGFSGMETSCGRAMSKLYWIGVIGPHWIYGEKEENGQDPKALIRWHDTTHDDASYHDFLQLVKLVASM